MDWFEDVAVTVTAAAPDSVSLTTKLVEAGTFFPAVWLVGEDVSVGAVFGRARVVNDALPGVDCAFQRASFATKYTVYAVLGESPVKSTAWALFAVSPTELPDMTVLADGAGFAVGWMT